MARIYQFITSRTGGILTLSTGIAILLTSGNPIMGIICVLGGVFTLYAAKTSY